MPMSYPVQRSYADVIMQGFGNVGNAIDDNRRRADALARQQQEADFREQSYARQLGLDEYQRGQDVQAFDYRRSQDEIDNARADRQLSIQEQAAQRETTHGQRAPIGYRWTADGNLEAIKGGPATAGRTSSAPAGYEWNEDNTALRPIRGGPAEKLPSEVAARVGMSETFNNPKDPKEAETLDADVAAGAATGPIDYAMGVAGYGRSGEIRRSLLSGVDALRRMLTGAGMNVSEANDYANRYLPTMKDNADILTDKVKNLRTELAAIKESVMRGRTPASNDAPPAETTAQAPEGPEVDMEGSGEDNTPIGATATNPETGERVRFDGSNWVPF